MLDISQIESFYPEPYRVFKRNILREYLQYKILEIIFNSVYASQLAFMGGTSIRIVHGNNRFSEDLDFDNFHLSKNDFQELARIIHEKLQLEGYSVEIRTVFKGAYHCYIAFLDILQRSGISGHREEKLLISMDTEPQGIDYTPSTVILNKFDVFTNITIVPVAMLLSQKLFAILSRKRTLGRDFYDAIFLFGKTAPDLNYLKVKANINTMDELKARLLAKIEELNLNLLCKDIEPFLIRSDDAKKILLFGEFVKTI